MTSRTTTIATLLLAGLAIAAGGCANNDRSAQASWDPNRDRMNGEYNAEAVENPSSNTMATPTMPVYRAPTFSTSNNEINRGNVGSIQQISTLDLIDCSALQGPPSISGDRLSVNTASKAYTFDPETGKQLWTGPYQGRVLNAQPNTDVAPVTTAGGLTFAAEGSNLVARDSSNGQALYTYTFPGNIYGINTYTANGRQYIAVTSSNKDGNCNVAILGHPKNPITLAIDEHNSR